MDSHPDFKTDLTYSLPDSAPRQRQKLSQCAAVSLLRLKFYKLKYQCCSSASVILSSCSKTSWDAVDSLVTTSLQHHIHSYLLWPARRHTAMFHQARCHYKVWPLIMFPLETWLAHHRPIADRLDRCPNSSWAATFFGKGTKEMVHRSWYTHCYMGPILWFLQESLSSFWQPRTNNERYLGPYTKPWRAPPYFCGPHVKWVQEAENSPARARTNWPYF